MENKNGVKEGGDVLPKFKRITLEPQLEESENKDMRDNALSKHLIRRSESDRRPVSDIAVPKHIIRRSESLKVRRHGNIALPVITIQGADDSGSEVRLVSSFMKSDSLDTGLEKKFRSDTEFKISPKKLVSLSKNSFFCSNGNVAKPTMTEYVDIGNEKIAFAKESDALPKANLNDCHENAPKESDDVRHPIERKSSVPMARKSSLQSVRPTRRLSPVPNSMPSPEQRKQSLTKLMDTGKKRRDSIAALPSASAFSTSRPKHRRVSLVQNPTIPRRRNSIKDTLSSYVGSSGAEGINAWRMRDGLRSRSLSLGLTDEEAKTVNIETKTIDVTIPVYTVSQNGSRVKITDIKSIEDAIHRLNPEVTIIKTEEPSKRELPPLRSSSDTQDKMYEKAKGTSVSPLRDEAVQDRANPDISTPADEDKLSSGHLTVIKEMDTDILSSPKRTDKLTLDRKISIRTCVRTMREDSEDYANQLRGCKNLGMYASMETLHVLLSKQDAVKCVVNAMNTFSDQEELQYNACASFLEMASISEANCFIIKESGGIPAIMSCMKCYSERVPLIKIILNVIGFLSSNEELAVQLLEQDCHSRVLSAMSQHGDDPAIVKQCLFNLGNLITTEETAKQIMLVGGVHTVIDMMNKFSNDEDILENGCRALGSFAVFDDTCLDVAQAGATKSVLLAMATSPDNVSILECGAWALACLTNMADTCEELQVQDGLEILQDSLQRHPREQGLQEYGVRTISNLACLDTTLQSVCTEQILAILQSVAVEFPDCVELLGHVMFSISQLGRGGDDMQRCILKCGGIKTVVDTMTLHQEDIHIQEHGCKILGNLAVKGELRRQVEEEGASRAVIGAMLTLDTCEDIQEYGCMALMNITADCKDNKIRVNNNGGVLALLNCLTNFRSRPNIVLSSLKTLGNIIELDEVCRLIMDERGLKTIVNITTSMHNNPEVKVFAAMVFCGLSGIRNLSIEDIELLDSTVTGMLSQPDLDADLVLFVCLTLENILKTDCGMHVFIAERRLEVILETMDKYGAYPEILQCACKMIAMLALDERHEMPGNAVRSVLSSMKAFTDNKDLQIVGCGALACICEKNLTLMSSEVTDDAVHIISTALGQHAEDHRLFAVALMAVTNLISLETATKTSSQVIHDLIFTAMTRFSENQEIQIFGCNAIAKCQHIDGDSSNRLLEVLKSISRRHGNKDPVHRPFAKALMSFWKAGYRDQITKILETNPAFQDVFSTELQESRNGDK